MVVPWTEEQEWLRASARRLMAREIDPVVSEHGAERPLPPETTKGLIKKLVPLGYLGGVIPREHGGSGLDWVTYGVLIEELNPVLLFPVVAGSTVLPYTISKLATEEQRGRFLPRLMGGEALGCFALTEPDAGSNPAEIRTRVARDGDGWVLNGTKMWITYGSLADLVLVVASADRTLGARGLAAVLVERDASRFQARDIETMGLRHDPVSEIVFEDCRVPAGNMLGEGRGGYATALTGLQAARCLLAGFASLSIARRSLDAAVRYARERSQFGRPIGAHQLIQEMVAEMATELEAMRLLLFSALQALDRGGKAVKETSMAKMYATEAAVRIASRAVQIHGAYGLSKEFPVEGLFRDARMLTIPDGSTEIQKLIIGREVLGLQAFC